MSAVEDLNEYSFVLPSLEEKKVKKYAKEIEKLVDKYGFEEIKNKKKRLQK